MKLCLAAALAVLVAPSAVCAEGLQVQLKLDQTLVENFDGNIVPEAIAPFDAGVIPKTTNNGLPEFDFHFPGDLSARATPLRCKDDTTHTGCTGLRLTAYFDLPEGKAPDQVADLVNTFNNAHTETQVVYDKTGRTRVTLYVISDFGITKTNLAVHLYTFGRTALAWREALFPKPAAATGG
jgi:hypothetical protein